MPQIGRYPDNMTIGQIFEMMKDIRKSKDSTFDEELINNFELKKYLINGCAPSPEEHGKR